MSKTTTAILTVGGVGLLGLFFVLAITNTVSSTVDSVENAVSSAEQTAASFVGTAAETLFDLL